MAEEVKYNNTLVSGRADETLTYTKYVKDESSGKSTKELLDEKVNKTDQLGTTQIADKAVTNEKLAEHSVDNSKLSPDSVSYDKIQNDAVITEKIQDNAVTTEKVEEKAITNTKLGDQSVDGRVVREASLETKHFANESVTTEKVARKSITKDKLADNAVDASQVVDGSIGNSKLSPDSVTTEKIKDSSVTNEKVADDTLGIEKFDPELRKTIQAATGLPDDLSQMIQDVDKSVKQLKEKDTDLQSQINDKQQQITANDDDISLLQTRSTQMEKAIKRISASGGASQASAVTYENTESGLDSVTAQGAIDELANKKFNKENIAQEFGDSKDKVVSQFALPFREIDSPEFIKAIVDAEDHFLFGIQLDGSIEWCKGIPAPIRAKLQEIIKQCQQDKTDIFEAINAAKKELSASITALQGSKVDKEEGKSLIEDEVKECFRVIENEEFLKAIVDADDKVLFGIYRATGKPYFPKNKLYHLVKNDEYLIAWVDKEDRIAMGIKRDGYLYMRNKDLENTIEKLNSVCIDVSVLKDITSRFSKQNNDNLLWAETDSEDKVIGYTAKDGSHYFRNLKSETIPDEFYHIKNQEGILEAKTDSEDRVISFRDKDGYLNEMVGIKSNSLLLSEKGFNDFKKALADSGFDNSFANWSSYLSNDGEKPLNLPTPKCAVINISTNVEISSLLKMGMEGAKNGVNYNVPAEIEFLDMNGNFFKKPILLTGQGRSSMSHEKKNMSIDLFDSSQYDSKGNLGKGEAFSVKFGDWVAQDGFHLKAYYTDFFRGINNVAYKFWYEIEKTRGFLKDATWKKGLLNDSILNKDINDMSIQIDNGARCVPDGFPSVVYINGDFYGLYSLNLKKHRDNYNMDKNNSNHVHLDGIVDGSTMWYNLDWTAFEVRNPKFLVYKTAQYDKENGKYTYEYNADIAQAEIAGLSDKETSSVYSSSVSYSKGSLVTVGNKLFMSLSENNIGNDPSLASYGSKPKDVYKKATEHWIEVTHTNNAKQAVLKLSKAILNIRNSSNQKEEFEKIFDAENLIDYTILMSFTRNKDGNGNNWQWTTWNGGDNWFVNVYDCDSICGGMHTGVYISELSASIIGGSESGNTNDWQPAYYAIQLYKTELKERWNELKDTIVNPQHFVSMLKKYMNRYPKSAYEEEYSKWINCPCNRDSNINSEYWVSANKFLGHAPTDGDGALLWNESTAYKAQPASGETNLAYIRDGNSDDYYLVKCIKDCVNQNPIVQEKLYSKYPSVLGQRDSIFKLYTRMNKMYIELDKIINQLK